MITAEKGKKYRARIKYHQLDELSGATVIVEYSGVFFKVNWRGHKLILGNNQVEIINELESKNSETKAGSLFNGKN